MLDSKVPGVGLGFLLKLFATNSKWDLSLQQQAFEQIKQEIARAVALGPVRTGQDEKNILYTAAGEKGPTWILWQRASGETRG